MFLDSERNDLGNSERLATNRNIAARDYRRATIRGLQAADTRVRLGRLDRMCASGQGVQNIPCLLECRQAAFSTRWQIADADGE